MKIKTDENELIQAFTTLIKLPLPDLRTSLAHKAVELEYRFKDDIEEYRKIERLIDPEGKQEKTAEKEHVKEIKFEIRKKRAGWMVNPVDIPHAVINHILSQDAKPGIIKMEKFKLPGGQKVDLCFEKKRGGYFTGSIKEKGTEKETKQAKQKTNPIKQAGETKTEDIKTLITYLLNCEFLFNCINKDFKDKWKPLIDQGIIKNNLSKDNII